MYKFTYGTESDLVKSDEVFSYRTEQERYSVELEDFKNLFKTICYGMSYENWSL